MVEETKKEDKTLTPEELEAEKQEEETLLATPEEAEVRAEVIKELGLDEDTQSELITKITQKRLGDMKSFGKLVGQKRGWREKALKKPEVKPIKKELKPKLEKDTTDEKWKKRMEFVVANRDLSKEEVNEVIAYAEGKGIGYEEALKSSFVSSAIKSMRAKAKADKETPPPSSRTPKPGEKTEKKKHPSFEEWKKKRKAKSVE